MIAEPFKGHTSRASFRFLLVSLLWLLNACSVSGKVYSDGSVAVEWFTADNGFFSATDLGCLVYDIRNSGTLPATIRDRQEDIVKLDKMSMSNMVDECMEHQSSKSPALHHRIIKRSIVNILDGIYPGTKWCGKGSIATNLSDLGYYNNTDMCCREHDQCDDYITSGQRKYGILNVQRYTICSCECDARFRQCLQNVGTFTSAAMGGLFFNVIGIQCLEKRYVARNGVVLGVHAWLVRPEPYQQRKKSEFHKLLAGEVSLGSFLGSVVG